MASRGVAAIIAWIIYSPALPNTSAAREGFYEMTGRPASDVSNIYYDSSSDFFGDWTKYLRFTYPDDQWIEGFLAERTSLSPVTSMTGTGPRWKWWDFPIERRHWAYFDRWNTYPCVALAVDYERRRVYLIHMKL